MGLTPIASGDRRRRRSFLHGLILFIIVTAVLYSAFPALDLFPSQNAPANPLARLSMPAVAAAVPPGLDPVFTSRVRAAVRAVSQAPVYPELATRAPTQPQAARIGALGLEDNPERAERQAAEPPPTFTVYTVQPGDTVSGLAARFGLQPESIMWNNVEISDEDVLEVGQQLRIPVTDGIIHEVRLGDTLSDIAARYSAEVDAIAAFPSNRLASPNDIHETQLVFVPGGQMPPPPPPPPPPPAASARPAPPASAAAPAPGPASSAGFIWPATGPISSYFGPSHPPGGIDIDQYNSPNAPVVAAADGVVTFAGGDPCCSYGIYVVIVHPNGFETLYAHLSSVTVVRGQTVSQGEVIGYVGCTGYCTGNHLHFELIIGGRQVDPLAYLP